MDANSAPKFWGNSLHQEKLDMIRQYCPDAGSLLDLGSGRGAYTIELRSKGYEVVGVDSIDYPEWKEHPAAWFRVGRAESLPFEDAAFDCTLAFEILEHCDDYRAVLREIARCTRRWLILSVPDCNLETQLRAYNLVPAHWTDQTHVNFWTRETLAPLLEEEGWAVRELTGTVKIKPSHFFWNSLRLPKFVTSTMKKLCDRLDLVETCWSSVLIVAERKQL